MEKVLHNSISGKRDVHISRDFRTEFRVSPLFTIVAAEQSVNRAADHVDTGAGHGHSLFPAIRTTKDISTRIIYANILGRSIIIPADISALASGTKSRKRYLLNLLTATRWSRCDGNGRTVGKEIIAAGRGSRRLFHQRFFHRLHFYRCLISLRRECRGGQQRQRQAQRHQCG